jgi:hypothetical protein
MEVFVNNGKPFLSRIFRLTKNQDELVLDENKKSKPHKVFKLWFRNSEKKLLPFSKSRFVGFYPFIYRYFFH